MTAESIQIQHLEAENKIALEGLKSRLEMMAAFNWEELKLQAQLKAEEERSNK